MKEFISVEHEVIYRKIIEGLELSQVKTIEDQYIDSNICSNTNNKKINAYFNEITSNIKVMENTRSNHAFRHISSHRKCIGKFIVFTKKIIRKCLKWYIEPICFQQTDFNNAITPCIGRLTEVQMEVINQINNIAMKQEVLEKQIEQMVSQNKEVSINALYENLIKQIDEKLDANIDTMQNLNTRLEKYETEQQITRILINQLESKVEKLQYQPKVNTIMLEKLEKKVEELQLNVLSTKDLENKVEELRLQQELVKISLHELTRKSDILNQEYRGINENFWNKNTVSQSGEDAIIAYITMVLGIELGECTYLDLGANHAKDLSNTYLFYTQGARGVLVEANPQLIPELKFHRNGDIILNKCISDKEGEIIDFYILNGDGLSTPDLKAAEEVISKNADLKIVNTIKVETITVNKIIEDYFGKAPVVLNIDIEGKDMEVLESIDFNKYRPLIIVVEMIEYEPYLVLNNKNNKILDFMRSKGYIEYAFTGINSIFVDGEQLKEGR